jgi:hypothetical protein
LWFRVPDISKSASAKNEVFDLIHRHAQAADLRLHRSPTPVQRLAPPPASTQLRPHRGIEAHHFDCSMPSHFSRR